MSGDGSLLKPVKQGVRRVLVGPVEIAGIACGLVQGLRQCQVDARLMLSTTHPFNYNNEPVSWMVRAWQKIGAARASTSRKKVLRKIFLVVAHDLWGWLVLARVVAYFDAFIFIYGQTITNSKLELWLLRCLGKKIVFIYTGSDCRPPYIDGGWFPGLVSDELPEPLALLKVVRRSKRKICSHERYADYLVNSPASAHFQERAYINWFAMGIPRVMPEIARESAVAQKASGSSRPVRILHSPSNPLVKGTAIILVVVENLRRKGHQIELVKIQGMPNEVVLKELSQCDFVVDQLYSDTPLAAFATEAAFFGKPAVVGGYFADAVGSYLAESDLPPSLFVLPMDIESAVERLILDVALRRDLGERARQFVLARWSLLGVSQRYLQLLNDDVPSQWWCEPGTVRYVRGCGLPQGRARRLVGLLLDNFGSRALQVCDKPELEAAFVMFAQERVGQEDD